MRKNWIKNINNLVERGINCYEFIFLLFLKRRLGKEEFFMDLMKGKKGIIFGVSNTHGIAYGIAKQLFDEGADIAFTYAGEAMEKRVKPIAESMNAKLIMSCDVTKEEEVEAVFKECEKIYGKLDFVVHAVAFAPKEDLMGRFVDTSKEGWDIALGVSAYSLVRVCRHAAPLMNKGCIRICYEIPCCRLRQQRYSC